jgi:hypothetical protein
MEVQPIILIGAARSGTKLVRDSLALHPQVSVVPYDVNFLWRLGNERVPHDELTVEHARPDVVRRVRQAILRFAKTPVLVEKTVSSSLRPAFVRAVFPEARIVHLVRDGLDVVESSRRQWLESPDVRYLTQKLRTVGIRSAGGYLMRYGFDTLKRLRRSSEPPMWGPVYDGMRDDYTRLGLTSLCALQWQACARAALDAPDRGEPLLRYESFVADPAAGLATVLDGLVDGGVPAVEGIRRDRIGSASALTEQERNEIMAIIGPTRAALGYG